MTAAAAEQRQHLCKLGAVVGVGARLASLDRAVLRGVSRRYGEEAEARRVMSTVTQSALEPTQLTLTRVALAFSAEARSFLTWAAWPSGPPSARCQSNSIQVRRTSTQRQSLDGGDALYEVSEVSRSGSTHVEQALPAHHTSRDDVLDRLEFGFGDLVLAARRRLDDPTLVDVRDDPVPLDVRVVRLDDRLGRVPAADVVLLSVRAKSRRSRRT